jgi:hypothetical protein
VLSFPGNRQTKNNGKLPPTEKKMNISGKHTKKKRITTIVEYRGRRRRSKKKKISKLGQIN